MTNSQWKKKQAREFNLLRKARLKDQDERLAYNMHYQMYPELRPINLITSGRGTRASKVVIASLIASLGTIR